MREERIMSWTHPEIVSTCKRVVYSSSLRCPECRKPIKKGTKATFAVDDKGRGTAYHTGCTDHLSDIDREEDEYIACGDIEEGMIG